MSPRQLASQPSARVGPASAARNRSGQAERIEQRELRGPDQVVLVGGADEPAVRLGAVVAVGHAVSVGERR